MADRLFVPPNAARPKANCGKDFSDQVLLHARGGSALKQLIFVTFFHSPSRA
jgi:hypothetical protein